MKQICFFLLILLSVFKLPAQNETKKDTILKVNGDELRGKVTEMSDSVLKFVHEGENLTYTIKKSEVLKITYSSGRVEYFNRQPLSAEKKEEKPEKNTSSVERHNKAAVLPFNFIKDNQSTGDEMAYKIQEEVYAFLKKNAAALTIQDTRTTNALLLKAGITRDKMMGYTMVEICELLGVEYLVEGTISQNSISQTSYQSGQYNTSTKSNSKTTGNNGRISGSSYSTTSQNYKTSITMNIYNNNAAIYSQKRDALFTTNDGSYKNTLEYILKRCPLYKK